MNSRNNQRRPYYPRQLIPRANWAAALGVQSPPPCHHHQQQHYYYPPVIVSAEEEKRVLDAWTTKLARTKRKMARQIRIHLKSTTTTTTISPPSSINDVLITTTKEEEQEEEVVQPNNVLVLNNQDLYSLFTPDNKRLSFVLKKELKNSDVGSLGRIVLPKREAEDKLPSLFDKEGIQLIINDIYSNKQWGLRYKYWSNNKSRMYVLENTVDFVKQNGLERGDSVSLYEDECKNLYYVAMKKGNKVRAAISSESSRNINNNNNNLQNQTIQNTTSKNENDMYEEDKNNMAYLEFLIQQLDQEANINNTLLTSTTSSHDQHDNNLGHIASAWPNNPDLRLRHSMDFSGVSIGGGDGIKAAEENFDDCYGDLGSLPEVDRYNNYYGGCASLFDHGD